MAEAKSMTTEKLPEFLKKLSEHEHDYNTIVYATAAAAVAAANAIGAREITGFQGGCVMWEFIREWGAVGDGPLRLQQMRNLLYPQYAYHFNSIPRDTWDQIVQLAKTELEKTTVAHPDVLAHQKKIAAGIVPFGLRIEER